MAVRSRRRPAGEGSSTSGNNGPWYPPPKPRPREWTDPIDKTKPKESAGQPKPSKPGISQGQADGLAQFARDIAAARKPASGDSGSGAALASIASQMGSLRDLVGQRYDEGSAAIVRAALGGRNSINDAGSAMQKALSGIKGDSMKEQGKVGALMKKELAALLARQDADQGRSQNALSLRGAYDPSVNALFQSNDMALRSQAQNNEDFQSRLMQVFGQEMSGRAATGKQITGGALSTLSNNEEMQRAALESERSKALSDLLLQEQQAQAAARSGGGGGGGGGSPSVTKMWNDIQNGLGFNEDMAGGKNPDPYRLGVHGEYGRVWNKFVNDEKNAREVGVFDKWLPTMQAKLAGGADPIALWKHDLAGAEKNHPQLVGAVNAVFSDYIMQQQQGKDKQAQARALGLLLAGQG